MMPNRLARETSPYLQQHAHNPVDWHAWGEEALERARKEDKPILLSVGYSACHWCHVMAHESFEDPAVAEVMNRLFVNVKVDREERPDLDQIYQLAHQMLAQRPGGWPLTMFLTPDGAPFFGGTYFPKEPRYNLPGFPQLLERVAQIYRENRDEIGRQNETILATFERMHPGAPAHHSELTAAPIDAALRSLKASFDSRYGGFGGAPKFPHPAELEFWRRRCGRAGRHVYARAHGARGNLRPDRGRVLALQRGCRVADPALREDALRQRAALAPVFRCVDRDEESAVRACDRGDRGVGDARDAVPGGRILLVARRGFGARGGQVLRLDARGSAGAAFT